MNATTTIETPTQAIEASTTSSFVPCQIQPPAPQTICATTTCPDCQVACPKVEPDVFDVAGTVLGGILVGVFAAVLVHYTLKNNKQ